MQHQQEQHQLEQQCPHFFAMLQCQQRPHSARPGSAASRPTARHTTTQDLQLQEITSSQVEQQRRRSASPPHITRPASAAAAKARRRPVSAAPNFMVAAHRVGAGGGGLAAQPAAVARPFSAVPVASQPPTKEHHQQLGLPDALHVTHMQQHRPVSAAWPHNNSSSSNQQGRVASANPRLQQQQQQQQTSRQQVVRPSSALPKQHANALACGQLPHAGDSCVAPAWLSHLTTEGAAAGKHSVTMPAAVTVARISSSSSGSRCSCSGSVATGADRPSSPLGHGGTRSSASSSSPDGMRQASRAAWRQQNSSSPWGAFGTDAPLVWQRVSSPDTHKYLEQQHKQVLQLSSSQQQQQQGCETVPADSETVPADKQQHGHSCDHQQPTEACWQQQQQCCHHQAALQLFKQLPLSGAAASVSPPREVLQQMGLGLQLELQRLGGPLELRLPGQLVTQGSSCVQQAGSSCPAAAGQVHQLPADWSTVEQVSLCEAGAFQLQLPPDQCQRMPVLVPGRQVDAT